MNIRLLIIAFRLFVRCFKGFLPDYNPPLAESVDNALF